MFKLFKKKETPAKPVQVPEPVKTPDPPKPKPKRYTFKVAGISYHENEIMENLLMENYEYAMSKKELVEMGMTDTMIFKYTGLSTNVQLLPDPDNEYDPNAIKVIADGIFIGHVPAKETAAVRDLLTSDDLKIGCSFHGGEYKILSEDYDTGKYKVETGKHNIGAEVTIKY